MSEATVISMEEHAARQADAEVQTSQHLTFKIAGETYAVGILQVKELLRYDTITKVPSTPLSIMGVMNLRGGVVPVVDLAIKFGLPESEITKWSCVIIVEAELDGERTLMGVLADSVSEVVELRPEDIEPPPPFGTRVRVDYLIGMGKSEKKFVLILDIDKVLSADELMTAALYQSESDVEEATAEKIDAEEEIAAAGADPSGEEISPPENAAPEAPGQEANAAEAEGSAEKSPEVVASASPSKITSEPTQAKAGEPAAQESSHEKDGHKKKKKKEKAPKEDHSEAEKKEDKE